MRFTLQKYSCEWQISLVLAEQGFAVPSLSLAAMGVLYSLFWDKYSMPCVVFIFLIIFYLFPSILGKQT